jgi:hypothetical protein
VRAVQITEFGGPEVLTPTDLPDPEAAHGSTLVEVSRAWWCTRPPAASARSRCSWPRPGARAG